MLESLSLAEEEEEDSACWFEGANERKADISYSVMPRLKRDICCIKFLSNGKWGRCLRVKGEEEPVNFH